MSDALEARFQEMLARAKEQCDSVPEAHRRWNRVEEAVDPVCEDAIYLLDRIGRIEQAEEIQSHMSLLERFELLARAFRAEAAAIGAAAREHGLEQEFDEAEYFLRRYEPWVEEERKKVGK